MSQHISGPRYKLIQPTYQLPPVDPHRTWQGEIQSYQKTHDSCDLKPWERNRESESNMAMDQFHQRLIWQRNFPPLPHNSIFIHIPSSHVFPWFSKQFAHVFRMNFSWFSYDFPTMFNDVPMISHRFSHEFLMISHVFLWFSHDFPWFPGLPPALVAPARPPPCRARSPWRSNFQRKHVACRRFIRAPWRMGSWLGWRNSSPGLMGLSWIFPEKVPEPQT